MEKVAEFHNEDEQMELPPGFRFHPTDEELISHYLSPKVLDRGFTARAIGDADLNKSEPWDLPWRAKMGEKEWYFFCVRDRKYPTGLRTNRATEAGYWKATGKDKEIYKAKELVGMKKTLVFYKGRAPKGEKTNWVMHEYRLEGKYASYNLPKIAKNEWVICRIFHKCSGGQKIHISGLVRENEFNSSLLPPLMDSPPFNNSDTRTATNAANLRETSHASFFSDPTDDRKPQDEDNNCYISNIINMTSDNNNVAASSSFPFNSAAQSSYFSNNIASNVGCMQFSDSGYMQDHQSVMRLLSEPQAPSLKRSSSNYFGAGQDPMDFDSFWNYMSIPERSFSQKIEK